MNCSEPNSSVCSCATQVNARECEYNTQVSVREPSVYFVHYEYDPTDVDYFEVIASSKREALRQGEEEFKKNILPDLIDRFRLIAVGEEFPEDDWVGEL